jgi:dihydropteroate synthase
MGVLNATPDSFWSGSRVPDVRGAVRAGARMFRAGAWVVDVGGESTRPGAFPVPPEEEERRVVPIIAGLAGRGRVSVDTRHEQVARAAVAAGATILNDVSGCLGWLAAELDVAYVGVHSRELPVSVTAAHDYIDVVAEVSAALRTIGAAASARGAGGVWVDPGIGFGKSCQDSMRLLAGLPALCGLGFPVALGVSRKSLIGEMTGRSVVGRLPGSLALAAHAYAAGVDLIRVHDVAETCDLVQVLTAVTACRRESVLNG